MLTYCSLTAVKDEQGAITTYRGIIRDITERKKAEEALRESEEKYRDLVENINDILYATDEHGTVTYIAPTIESLSGYTTSEITGRPFSEFVYKEDIPFVLEKFQQDVSGHAEPNEYRILTKSGVVRWVRTSSRPFFRETRVVGLRGVMTDVTDRKRAEEESEALREQLRQSQKMEAIGRLAGGIAHDFNNLLTIIKGYSQLSLIELKEDSPLKGSIEQIDKATDRAADLVRQLLAFSRRQILEMRVLDLNTTLANLHNMLRRLIGEDIELTMVLAEDLGRVKTDLGWIEQAIMNLVVNAKDAMPKGGKLTIETANVELDEAYARAHVAVTSGRYVMIAVSDTGAGMTPEVRERLFEPFFSTKEKDKGTGLGLSTVYGIVKQSGGNIWVYSEPGKGSTFKIYLPRVDEPLEQPREKLLGDELLRGSETILLVEDEEEVRKLAVRVLERQGYKVLSARDGDEALLVCERHKDPIHLMLTDVVMPGMSGHEVAKRSEPSHPEMKVLYMSGYTDNAIVMHGVLVQGVNYIQKPFTVNGLTKKVREVLEQ
jgi:PAS domain S-box-containing protein